MHTGIFHPLSEKRLRTSWTDDGPREGLPRRRLFSKARHPYCDPAPDDEFKDVFWRNRLGFRGQLRRIFRFTIRFNGGQDKDLVFPHDWRRTAFAHDGESPLDVGLVVPGNGRVALRRDPIGIRTAPLMPIPLFEGFKILGDGGTWGDEPSRGETQKQEENRFHNAFRRNQVCRLG